MVVCLLKKEKLKYQIKQASLKIFQEFEHTINDGL